MLGSVVHAFQLRMHSHSKVHVIISIYVYVYIIAINSYIRLHTYITDIIYSIVCLRFLIASHVATSSYMITYNWEKFKVGNIRAKKVRGKNIFISAGCR